MLVDDACNVAAGKALDIRQTGPVEAYDTAVDGTDDVSTACASVDVDRDGRSAPRGGDSAGDLALQMLSRVARLAPGAPLVLAGVGDHVLMTLAMGELKVSDDSPDRVRAGGGRGGRVGAQRRRALTRRRWTSRFPVLGLPPAWVLAWDRRASAGGAVEMPAHATARVEQTLASSWPPGPYSLASAAAAVVRAMLSSVAASASAAFRRRRSAASARWSSRRRSRSSPSGIASVVVPELTPRQRVALESTVLART